MQRSFGEKVGRGYPGILVGDEQRGVRGAVAVPGVLVCVVERRAVRHAAFEVYPPVLEHVHQVDSLLVGGFALGFHELVRPAGELGDALQVIVGVAFEAAVGVAADHARDIHVPYPDHALAGVGGRRARCLRCRFGERLARRDAGVKRRERYERAGEQHNEGNFRCNGESRYP